MFLDEATIDISGGAGGRGAVSWRREKYIPKGGPDGGNGGRGGDIVLLANENTDTLSDYASKKRFAAEKGRFGSGNNRAGKSGEDLVLKVPPGTTITEILPKGSSVLADLAMHGERILLARGGRGGYGNAHFKSSVRQRPDFAELGEAGEKKTVRLSLKLVADVGIIGYPSVGKSSLISVVSAARPKIADYPFTTLIPNLGVVKVAERSFVICDVPGLIEGASEGKGLGDRFLKHVERCGLFLHLLDVQRALKDGHADADPLIADYRSIRSELKAYSPALAEKKEFVILNKVDLIGNESAELERALNAAGIPVFMSISAATTYHTADLMKKILPEVLREREKRVQEAKVPSGDLPVLKPHLLSRAMGAYRIERSEKAIVVHGLRIEQFTSMTSFSSIGARKRFLDVCERIGLKKAINRERMKDDLPVYIGKIRVDTYL
ncbi:TPA: GTPase ObgE [Candidatus Peribacteria bacterium]|nr:GTPase ObgE [Candidatus Peribacteria bacterium]HAS34240.1 GTPase ObgE [Candidatus Peribacteria bacterium]